MNVLMVCLGNICRSPMAEGVLRAKAHQYNILLEIDSAGTGSWHIGAAPDERAIKTMRSHSIDISKLKGRQIKQEDFHYFDYIFVMDTSNYADVLAAAPKGTEHKVSMLMNLVEPASNVAVPDPYFGGSQGFDNVYNMLDRACEAFIQQISTNDAGQ